MANIPCCTRVLCPGDNCSGVTDLDFECPTTNYSTEAPDIDKFIGYAGSPAWGSGFGQPAVGNTWPNPTLPGFCESTVSQAAADACAGQQTITNTITNTGTTVGNQGPPQMDPNKNPVVDFGNDFVSCTAFCPDGSPFVFGVVANSYLARSKALANQIASSAACTAAFLARVCLSDLAKVPGCVGSDYNNSITATGGTGSYSWAINGGSLPLGLNFSTSGNQANITGVPSTPGTYLFSVIVQDSRGSFMQKSYSISVLGLPSTTLPQATVGSPYSFSLSPSGGSPPYTYLPGEGTLPTGITFSGGTFSGTPAANTQGSYTYDVQVTDSGGNSCTFGLLLGVINPPCVDPTQLVWNNFNVSPPNNGSLTFSFIANNVTIHETNDNAPNNGYDIDSVVGTFPNYTGPGCSFRVRIISNITGIYDPNTVLAGFWFLLNGNTNLGVYQFKAGFHDDTITVTLPAGVNQTLIVKDQGFWSRFAGSLNQNGANQTSIQIIFGV